MTELRRSEITRLAGWAVGAVAVAFAAMAFASCFNPDIPSNSFRCNLNDPEPVCPAGQECVSGWCVNPGDPPATDAGGGPGTDAADSGPVGTDAGTDAGSDGGGTCGNDVIDGTEECDGADLGAGTCVTEGFFGGPPLTCTAGCTYDTSACTDCGNDIIDSGEACDGAMLGGMDCVMMGFASGTLLCTEMCAFDTSMCIPEVNCGNGAIDAGEDCDGTNLGGATCATEGGALTMGTLGCTGACLFDTSGCSLCGNMIREGSEECDDADLGTATCASLGHVSGTLGCLGTCLYDESTCSDCGNGMIDGTELCDGTDLGTPAATCVGEGFPGGGTLGCAAGCMAFDTTMCLDCMIDAHCSGTPATPACDTTANVCVLCFGTSTMACGPGETCDAMNRCDCSGTTSTTGEACAGTANPTCLASGCGCDADSTCGTGETCDSANGECECGTTAPATGSACGIAAAVCGSGVCDCDGAGGGAACTAGQTCNGAGMCTP